jgi:hypothetical protein
LTGRRYRGTGGNNGATVPASYMGMHGISNVRPYPGMGFPGYTFSGCYAWAARDIPSRGCYGRLPFPDDAVSTDHPSRHRTKTPAKSDHPAKTEYLSATIERAVPTAGSSATPPRSGSPNPANVVV